MTKEELMRKAIELSKENVENGGGPFGAVIATKDGVIIATGVNRVTTSCDPTAHAEVSAIRAAAAKLTDGGRIIFIGSLLGSYVPFAGAADYAGSKTALVGYARGVARDLGGRNITVNVIQPGVMPTDMAAAVLGENGAPDALLDLHPIRRIATLEEVSETVCFIAGPHAGYITGETINVAGGLGI